MASEYITLSEFTKVIDGKISKRALARICGINESLLLQYSSGSKQISEQTISLINNKIHQFADGLMNLQITGV